MQSLPSGVFRICGAGAIYFSRGPFCLHGQMLLTCIYWYNLNIFIPIPKITSWRNIICLGGKRPTHQWCVSGCLGLYEWRGEVDSLCDQFHNNTETELSILMKNIAWRNTVRTNTCKKGKSASIQIWVCININVVNVSLVQEEVHHFPVKA